MNEVFTQELRLQLTLKKRLLKADGDRVPGERTSQFEEHWLVGTGRTTS